MKSIVVNYDLNSDKVDDLNLTLVGDIHNFYNKPFFKDIIKDIKDVDSDLLLIAGDTCNSGNSWNKKEKFLEIKKMLEELREARPVVIIMGNDIFKIKDEGLINFKKLADIKDVYPLYNESVDFKFNNNALHIDGYVPDNDSYITKGNDKKRQILGNEKEIIAKEVKRINDFDSLLENNFNILLNHDSRIVRFDEIIDTAKKYDLITGAHMHNGYVPLSYTTKHANMYDNDYFYFLSKNNTAKKGYVRGVIFGHKDEFVLLDQLGNYYYKNGDEYTLLDELDALLMIKKFNCPPIVITAGINKYVGLPIDNPEIIKINVKNQVLGK